MNQCPICKLECTIKPAEWDGGRMTIECASCGSIAVSEDNFQKITSLPEDHWQMKILRDGIVNVKGPLMISRNSADILQIGPLKSKLTKMEKWSLRRKAEGNHQPQGRIYYSGNDEKKST